MCNSPLPCSSTIALSLPACRKQFVSRPQVRAHGGRGAAATKGGSLRCCVTTAEDFHDEIRSLFDASCRRQAADSLGGDADAPHARCGIPGRAAGKPDIHPAHHRLVASVTEIETRMPLAHRLDVQLADVA